MHRLSIFTHGYLCFSSRPLLRETLFYLGGLTLFIHVIADSKTETVEALFMTSVYFIYVGTVIGMAVIVHLQIWCQLLLLCTSEMGI